jgi:phosphatidylinositol alpha-mannosyltransferase
VLARFAPDVVHVHEPLVPSLSMPAAWFARAPVVATFHAYCPASFESIVYTGASAGLRPLTHRLAVKMAVSRAAARCAERRVGGPMRIVPNGVDVERFALAGRMDLPRGRKLLFVNRLDRRKGFDVALDSFAALADRFDDLQLIVAGDGPYRSALHRTPERIRRRVAMLGDVAERELPSVYAAADVFLAPARGHESFGIVLLEAMAAGLPIVATSIEGYREVLQHERDALLVAPGDAGAIAAAVTRILRSPPLAADLVAGAGARVRAFRWDAIAAQIERHYLLAIDSARTSAAIRAPAPPLASDVT